MEKVVGFKHLKDKENIHTKSFNRKKFINEFVEVIKNKKLSKEQKVEILSNHCLYDKNSPLKLNKG